MAILTDTSGEWIATVHSSYVADTLAELQASAASYIGEYVRVVDQDNKVFYVKDAATLRPIYNLTYFSMDQHDPNSMNLYIQDSAPTSPPQKYLWIQTNYQEPGGITFWVEDGNP